MNSDAAVATTRRRRRAFGDYRGGDQLGGGCGCGGGAGILPQDGGYRATRRNRALLRKLRSGGKIGFTATASLKAKGLLPRTSRKLRGKRVLGPKYR